MGARGAGCGTWAGRDRGNQDRTGRAGGNYNVGLPVWGRTSGPLSHPESGPAYLQQHAEYIPADDEQFSRCYCYCRHGSESGLWRAGVPKAAGSPRAAGLSESAVGRTAAAAVAAP